MSASKPARRITISDIARMYEEGERFATITAYDYPTARIVDEAGIPLILVGDSLGMVMLGYDTTVRVSMSEMLHHTRAVARGAKRALVVGDMPFLTYGISQEESVEHAGRFLSEAYAQAVKIEGGVRSARTMEAIVSSGIPVMGHIGLTPQSVNALGGHRVQGRSKESARKLIADALAVQEAGAFAVVLELVPAELSRAITERLSIPTIGIGAGPYTSGEIQVITDVVGLTQGFTPRHARRFGEVGEALSQAVPSLPRCRHRRRLPCRGRVQLHGRGSPGRGPGTERAGSTERIAGHPARPRPLAGRAAMTRILHTRAELRAALADAPRPIGLVPTMGWLHDGHRALMRQARAENATAVVTIFVNPRQFDDASDYTRYPRDTAADIAICEAEAVDLVWLPEVDEVYPPGFDTTVSVGAVAEPLEGAARPGHFDGVATVVATLFALVGAEHAYFGQKDAQQVMVISRMAADLALPTQVIPCPTVREPRRAGAVVAQRAPHPAGASGGTGAAPGAAGSARGLPGGRARG